MRIFWPSPAELAPRNTLALPLMPPLASADGARSKAPRTPAETATADVRMLFLLEVGERKLYRRSGIAEREDGVERIGLGRGLVRAVAQDAREAQRDASRVAGAGLDPVERDLGDELGPDVDDPVAALGREGEQALGLPREHLVGETLEGLAEHHEPVAGARPEVEVGEEPLAAAVAPLGGEDHEVERVARLDLQPRGATPPG